MQNAVSKLREKIHAGIFDEETCQAIEAASKSSFDGPSVQLRQKLSSAELQLSIPRQAVAYVKYLTRLGSIAGVKDHYTSILAMVDTDNLDLANAVAAFVRRACEWDAELPGLFMERLFSVDSCSKPNSTILLAAVSQPHMKTFFKLACSQIQAGAVPSVTRSLELLGMVGHVQGPNLHEITQTTLMPTLLSFLQESQQPPIMLQGMMIVLMYIPWLLNSLPAWLNLIFGVVRRAVLELAEIDALRVNANSDPTSPSTDMASPPSLSPPLSPTGSMSSLPIVSGVGTSSPTSPPAARRRESAANNSEPLLSVAPQGPFSPNSSLTDIHAVADLSVSQPTPFLSQLPKPLQSVFRRCTELFIRTLYSIYPCNLLNFLRAESATNLLFKLHCRPIVAQFRMNPMLLEIDAAQELSLDRWRHVNPVHLAVDDFLWEFHSKTAPKTPTPLEVALNLYIEYEAHQRQASTNTEGEGTHNDNEKEFSPAPSSLASAPAVEPASSEPVAIPDAPLAAPRLISTPSAISSLPTEVADLQTMVVLQRNQILFEKFVQNQLSSRMVSLFKQSSNEDALRAEQAALIAKMEQFRQREDQLYKKWREVQDRVRDLREQNRKVHLNFTMQQNKLMESNRLLAAEAEQTRAEQKYVLDELVSLRQSAARKEDTILQLDARVAELSSMLHDQDTIRKRLRAFSEDIALWEIDRRQVHERMQEVNSLRQQVQIHHENIHQLSAALEKEMTKSRSLNAKLDEATERVVQVKAENASLHQNLAQMMELLEYQKSMTAAKMGAMQEKYQVVRKINVGYERHIMELQVELERYKQFTINLPEPSSSPISIPMAKPIT